MGAMGGGLPGIHSGEARTSDQHQIVNGLGGAIAKKAFYLLAPTSLSRFLPIFTDFYRFSPIFTDLSDFLGKTVGNIGNIG